MKKRILSTLLVASMTAGLLAGCGNSDEKTNTSSAASSASSVENSAASSESATETLEPMEISYVSWFCGDIEEGNYAEKLLEEALNIDLKISKVDISNAEQNNLMVNTGELPDCNWQSAAWYSNYTDGLIRGISEDMIREYAPNYAALLDENPYAWTLNKIPDQEGMYYALTGYAPQNGPGQLTHLAAFRYDWLQNGGFTPNGEIVELEEGVYLATEPFTKSQYVDILEYFTNGDPDGNGVDDTVGTTMAGAGGHQGWAHIYSIFSLNDRALMEQDGHAVDYFATDNFKEFLKFAADCYDKGYVDQEFATITSEQRWEKFATNKVGSLTTASSYVGTGKQHDRAKECGGTVLITPPVVNDDGIGGNGCYAAGDFSYAFAVREDVDDEKLARILMMFDYIISSDEIWWNLKWGEEGTHYEYTYKEDGVGYEPVFKEGVTNGADTGLGVFVQYWRPRELTANGLKTSGRMIFEYGASEEWSKYILKPYKYDFSGSIVDPEVTGQYASTVSALVNEYYFNAICGVVDVDSTWDEYIKSIYDAGYDKMVAEYDKMPLFE